MSVAHPPLFPRCGELLLEGPFRDPIDGARRSEGRGRLGNAKEGEALEGIDIGSSISLVVMCPP